MKKQIKKFAAIALSALMLQSLAIVPASAAVATKTGTDFETGYKMSAPSSSGQITFTNPSNAALFYAQGAIMDTEVNEETGETTTLTTSDTYYVTDDPNPLYPGDKALKVQVEADDAVTDKNIFSYFSGKNVKVFEFDFLFENAVHNFTIGMQTHTNKYAYLLSTVNNQGKMEIKKGGTTGVKAADAALNEWHHVKIVMNQTNVSTDSENEKERVYDHSKNTISVYFDDIKVWENEPVSNLISSTDAGNGINFFNFRYNKNNGIVNYYIDNFYKYNPDTESGFEMKSAEDYTNASYMNGKTFEFYAENVIGQDMNYKPVNRVDWYVDGEYKESKTVLPFKFSYTPETAGQHVVACELFTENDSELCADYKEMTVLVEPKFREEVIIKEDFNTHDGTFTYPTYTDITDETTGEVIGQKGSGIVEWADKTGNGEWSIRNTTTDAPPSLVTVDDAHGNSINLGLANGRRIDGLLNEKIKDGIVKTSMEVYVDGVCGNNNNIMVLMLGKDTYSMRLHNAQDLLNVQDGNKTVAPLADGRWYKIDWVTMIKNGTAYYTAYVDGKQVSQNSYAEGTDVSVYKGAMFLNSYSTTDEMYIDNLSISKIEYYDQTGFWCADTKVSSIAEMPGTVLTAKTAVVNEKENQQIMAVYDKTSGAILSVATGLYDETTGVYTSSIDLKDMDAEKVFAKVFIWNEMKPTLKDPEIIR